MPKIFDVVELNNGIIGTIIDADTDLFLIEYEKGERNWITVTAHSNDIKRIIWKREVS